MNSYGIYREPHGRQGRHGNIKRPTRIMVIEADSSNEAIKTFLREHLYKKEGNIWQDPIFLKQRPWESRYDLTRMVVRRFTPSGVYKGETGFHATKLDK